MISLAFYSIHYMSKIFGLEKKFYTTSLENRLNIFFGVIDFYFLITCLLFLILLGQNLYLAIVHIVITTIVLTVELSIKKPIMTKNLNDVYLNKFYVL